MTKKTCTEAQLREWVKAGETGEQIAKRLGRSAGAVYSACAVLGMGGKRGPRFPPMFDRSAAFELLKAGKTPTEIGKTFGVTRQAIYAGLRSAGYPCTHRLLVAQQAQQSA